MGGCRWHHRGNSHRLLWLDQIQELFCTAPMFVLEIEDSVNGLKQLANHRRRKKRFILIRNNMLFFFSFSRILKQMPEDPPPPLNLPLFTPTPVWCDIKHAWDWDSSPPPPRFLWFYNSFICDIWKTCKTLFALKFKEYLSCHRIAHKINSCSTALTADTGDHFIRKFMNLLLEKVPSLRHIKHSLTFFHQT